MAAVIFYQNDVTGVEAAQKEACGGVGDAGQSGVAPRGSAVTGYAFCQKTDTDSGTGEEPQSAVIAFKNHRFVKISGAAAFCRLTASPTFAVVCGFGVVIIAFTEIVSAQKPSAVFENGRLTAEETGCDETRFGENECFRIRIVADGGKGGQVTFIIEGVVKVALSPENPHAVSRIEKELDVDTADDVFSQTGDDQKRFAPVAAVIIAFDEDIVVAQRWFSAAAGVPAGIQSALRGA